MIVLFSFVRFFYFRSMQEDFLHHLWRHKKFRVAHIKTVNKEDITVINVGQYNTDSGPDFFNAQLKIDDQVWAGNVEVHIKSSDWYVHNHEVDPAYDNVILHVVWEHDTDIFRKDNTVIPTIELKKLVDNSVYSNYQKLFLKDNKWINCENDFSKADSFMLNNWLERLFFERLERKLDDIQNLLNQSQNNWEAVLFKMITKNFGLKVNGSAFLSLAESFDFSIIRKLSDNQFGLEALLFGQAGLLEGNQEEHYYLKLKEEYTFIKQKLELNNTNVLPIQFFRLRPLNFPTIRLSQLASLYHEHQNVFSKIIETNTIEDFYEIFGVATSNYWKTHYTFKKATSRTTKKLSKSFIDLLLINTIIPIKFCYARYTGKDVNEEILQLANHVKSEKNSIVTAFNKLKKVSQSSLQSQALIQLNTEYCKKNRCLKCVIGNSILNE